MAEGFTTSERLPETGLLLVGMGPGSVAAMTQEAFARLYYSSSSEPISGATVTFSSSLVSIPSSR